jgi:hypothetical protein
MGGVFVQHDAAECAQLFGLTAWYLLYAHTMLDVHSRLPSVTFRY